MPSVIEKGISFIMYVYFVSIIMSRSWIQYQSILLDTSKWLSERKICFYLILNLPDNALKYPADSGLFLWEWWHIGSISILISCIIISSDFQGLWKVTASNKRLSRASWSGIRHNVHSRNWGQPGKAVSQIKTSYFTQMFYCRIKCLQLQ